MLDLKAALVSWYFDSDTNWRTLSFESLFSAVLTISTYCLILAISEFSQFEVDLVLQDIDEVSRSLSNFNVDLSLSSFRI